MSRRVLETIRRARLAHFLVAGGIGFTVDASVLYLLVGHGIHFFLARLQSFSTAVVVTFCLNKWWTFPEATGHLVRRSSLYIVVQLTGGVINLTTFWSTAAVFDLTGKLVILPLIAGSAAAIAATYLGARFVAFRPN